VTDALHLLRDNLVGYAVMAALQVTVLLISVALERTGKVPREFNRKFVHAAGAINLLMAPVVLASHWAALVVAVAASLLLVASTAMHSLRGLHGVGRGVGGVATYPLAGWMLFYGAFGRGNDDWLAYVVPVLVLAAADAMGALVGTRWGRRRYVVAARHIRSLEGSLVVGAVAFLCTLTPILVADAMPWNVATLVAIYIGVTAASLEAVSTHGLDNVFVPLGTMVAFDAIRADTAGSLLVQLAAMAIAGLFVSAVIRGRSTYAGGPVLGAVLLFIVMKAGGFAWSLPFLVVILTYVIYDRLAPESRSQQRSRTALATVIAGLGSPTLLLVPWTLAETDAFKDILYLAYVSALACTAGVMWLALPQLRSFRYRETWERFVLLDPRCRYRLSLGSVSCALIGAALVASSGVAGGSPPYLVTTAMVAAFVGTLLFAWTASSYSARLTCPTCGSAVLLGLGCCDPPGGDMKGIAALDFSRTLALANIGAVAFAAAAVTIGWSIR
jgi:dolichol kinase